MEPWTSTSHGKRLKRKLLENADMTDQSIDYCSLIIPRLRTVSAEKRVVIFILLRRTLVICQLCCVFSCCLVYPVFAFFITVSLVFTLALGIMELFWLSWELRYVKQRVKMSYSKFHRTHANRKRSSGVCWKRLNLVTEGTSEQQRIKGRRQSEEQTGIKENTLPPFIWACLYKTFWVCSSRFVFIKCVCVTCVITWHQSFTSYLSLHTVIPSYRSTCADTDPNVCDLWSPFLSGTLPVPLATFSPQQPLLL